MSYDIAKGYSLTMLVTFIKYNDSTGGDNTQVFLVTATFGGTTVKRMSGNTDDNIRFYRKSGSLRCKNSVAGNTQFRILSIPNTTNLNSLSFSVDDDTSVSDYTAVTIGS